MAKKVFELAKEIGVAPLDLVESLKAKGFSIKNHMSDLSDEDVAKIFNEMNRSKENDGKDSPQKKAVRKKVTTKSTAKEDHQVTSGEIKVEKTEKVVKRSEPTSMTSNSQPHLSPSGDEAVSGSSVVRKKASVIRKKSDETDAQNFEEDRFNHGNDSIETLAHHDGMSVDIQSGGVSGVENGGVTTESTSSVQSPGVQSPINDVGGKIHSPASGTTGPSHSPTTVIKRSGDIERERTGGLRVVSKPTSKTMSETFDPRPEGGKSESGSSASGADGRGEKKELYKEKVHRFTPVFTPSKDAPKEEVKTRVKPTGFMSEMDEDDDDLLDDDIDSKKKKEDEEENRKRMGGLASLMSGKKVVSKSQVLNMTRAEDELKSYLTLSGTGRPIYTTVKRKKDYMGPTQQTEVTQIKDSKRVIQIHKGIYLGDMAQKLSLKFRDFADECLKLNLLVKETDYVGKKLAEDIANLWNFRVQDIAFDESKIIKSSQNKAADKVQSDYPSRPPVVAIMGHVDHGKTTLLDTIRKEKVADHEAGGITQHIGAYSVTTQSNQKITFLDTPGHAAFASMRQRGAKVTDIVILVVAADDGVMPQTKESIKYCENAGVPIIVAVNKMDKPGVNPDKIKQELTEFNLMPEDWGGQTQYVHVSALKAQGIDELLEAILLQAEILDLRANDKGAVEAVVVESKIEQGRGPMATILVQSGTLKKGDSLVAGETFGRARTLNDHQGKTLEAAGPSTPVLLFGLEEAPSPGDILNVVKNEREAKKIADHRIEERKKLALVPETKKVSLEDFFSGSNLGADGEKEKKTLNLIIRADVNGSYEAIKQALEAIGNNEVSVKVIAGGVGPIVDSDVLMAQTTGGYIIGFNMRPITTARKLAEDKGVDIKNYSIIYELINDIKLALEGLLDPEEVEEYIGRAEVREVFNIPKAGIIAGSYVIEGKILNNCGIRLLRNGKIVHDGPLSSLKRFKDDVKEVKNGFECGIALQNHTDIKSGDIFEAYQKVKKKRTLEEIDYNKMQTQSPEVRV